MVPRIFLTHIFISIIYFKSFVLCYETSLNCQSPEAFTVVTRSGEIIRVYDTELIFKYDEESYNILVSLDLSPIQKILTPKSIEFSGFVRSEWATVDNKTNLKIDSIQNIRIDYKKVPLNNKHSDYLCNLQILDEYSERSGVYAKIEDLIYELLESCLHAKLCNFWQDHLTPHSNAQYEGVQLHNVQHNINDIADLAIDHIVQTYLKENSALPNISGAIAPLNIALKINLTNWIILNTPKVERVGDVMLDHKGYLFSLSISLRVRQLNIYIGELKLSKLCESPLMQIVCGLISFASRVTAYIDRISFRAKVSVDYHQKPCKASLDDLDLYDFGNIKLITPDFPKEFQYQNESSSFMNQYIIFEANSLVKTIVSEHMIKLDCEKYNYGPDKHTIFEQLFETVRLN